MAAVATMGGYPPAGFAVGPAAPESPVQGGGWSGNVDLDAKYERMEVSGVGVFGTVWKARDRENDQIVAIKRLQFQDDASDGVPAHVIREVCILRDFRHPNVVRLLDVHVSGVAEYNLVFEYIDNDLHKVLKGHRRAGEHMPMKQVVSYAKDLLSGCQACHLRLIIHRDLKPQNILVSREGLKICDFGLARMFSPPLKAYTHDVVTLWYRSPEILLGTAIYGPEVDMWSAGCCIAEMATCHPLFPGDSEIGTIFKILRLLGTPGEKTWPGCSQLEHWKDNFPRWPPTHLLPLLEARPELEKSGLELLRGLLCLNPQARLSARRAKNHEFLASCSS